MKKPLKPLENYEQTKEKALRLLEFRNHSQKDLERKLKKAGAKEEDIIKTIEFLLNYNLINDTQYAYMLAQDLRNLKKYGTNRIKSELLSKGIDYHIIEEIMSEMPENDENELLRLIEKKLKGNFEQKNKDRAIRYFIYRGYMIDEIKKGIAMAEEQEKNNI